MEVLSSWYKRGELFNCGERTLKLVDVCEATCEVGASIEDEYGELRVWGVAALPLSDELRIDRLLISRTKENFEMLHIFVSYIVISDDNFLHRREFGSILMGAPLDIG